MVRLGLVVQLFWTVAQPDPVRLALNSDQLVPVLQELFCFVWSIVCVHSVEGRIWSQSRFSINTTIDTLVFLPENDILFLS